MTATSPQLALTLACCRWPRSASSEAAVRDAAALVTDWNEFDQLVERHRITTLARDALAHARVRPPASVDKRLRNRAAGRRVVSLSMVQESIRLQRAFDAAGLPAMIMKGATVGALAYGDPCLKESFDIDLLTSRDHVRQAYAVLAELGYELFLPRGATVDEFVRFALFDVEATLLNRDSGLAVDLHWGLDRNPRMLPGLDVDSPSQLVNVGGADLRTLRTDLLFAYLCSHGTKHAWARLKWLADLNALVAPLDADEVEALYDTARRVGAARAAAASLLLCERLFDLALRREMQARLEASAQVRLLERCALYYIRKRKAPTEPASWFPWPLYLSLLFVASGVGYVTRQLANIWNHPLELARYGSAAHILRVPLWLVRRMHGLSARLGRWRTG